MKKVTALLCLIISFINLGLTAQSELIKGYLINNSNEKIDCFFETKKWIEDDFEYRISENSEPILIKTSDFKEFGVLGKFKYERHFVKIDLTSKNDSKSTYNLDRDKTPELKEKTLFLEALVTGKANLYRYEKGKIKRFFISNENRKIEQLIFKKYLNSSNQISYNNRYKQQLSIQLKCKNITINTLKNIAYRTTDLTKVFIKYNTCANSDFTFFKTKNKGKRISLNLRPRFNLTNTQLNRESSTIGGNSFVIDYGNLITYGLGAELEVFFYKNDFSFIIEPTFTSSISHSSGFSQNLGTLTTLEGIAKFSYQAIEVPFGVRYYFFSKQKSKAFVNTTFNFSIDINSNLEVTSNIEDEIKVDGLGGTSNFSIGAGYKYDKYSLELRYNTDKKVNNKLVKLYEPTIKSFSIIFGYELF